MKTIKILALLLLIASTTGAQTVNEGQNFRQSINMCPLGIGFGIFSFNYEYMLNEHHGVVFRLDYEAIPDSYTDANIESDGKAVVLNYRYHFSGKLESIYVGAYGRHRIYTGEGKINSTNFNFDINETTIGLNVGKRWVWDSGFNINFTLGYGYSFKEKNQSLSSTAIDGAIKGFEEENDFIDAFLGEFSIGYAF